MSDSAHLVLAALAGIATIVLLITVLKVHPVVALLLGSLAVGVVAWEDLNKVVESFSGGFGDTMAGVGLLIGLGAMFGKLLFDSGGADEIVDTLVGRSSARMLPWTMAAVGALIGLPMFFEIGLVLLVPVIFLVARRAQLPLMTVAIPALAGLSTMHGFVPPHPGPLIAIDNVGANLGLTLALGVLLAIPTVVVAGPLFARLAARWVPVEAPHLFDEPVAVGAGSPGAGGPSGAARGARQTGSAGGGGYGVDSPTDTDPRDPVSQRAGAEAAQPQRRTPSGRQPAFSVTVATVLLPVVLMLAKALADVVAPDSDSWLKAALDFVGTPLIALLAAVLVGMATLGRPAGMSRSQLATTLGESLPPIASVVLIVGAGGGFKQVLVDTGIGGVITDFAKTSGISVLLLAWLVAVLVRLATGSATVATVTASGIMAPLVGNLDLSTGETSLLVLAVGAGSLFFSHVNDAGFWLIKEFFGIDVVQNIKTWSVMETVISVVGLVLVLVVGIFV